MCLRTVLHPNDERGDDVEKQLLVRLIGLSNLLKQSVNRASYGISERHSREMHLTCAALNLGGRGDRARRLDDQSHIRSQLSDG